MIAPLSATPLNEAIIDTFQSNSLQRRTWGLFPIRRFKFHINLDDVDLNKETLAETVARVMGRRGLGVWLLVSMR